MPLRLHEPLRSIRSFLLAFLDCGAVATAAGVTLWTLERAAVEAPPALAVVCVAVLSQAIVGLAVGVYRGRYAIGRLEEFGALVAPILSVAAVIFVVSAAAGSDAEVAGFVGVASACLATSLALGPRYLWRVLADRRNRAERTRRRALVVGAGDTGRGLIDAMIRDPQSSFAPVALLDDDPRKSARIIRGVPVCGRLEDLAAVAAKADAQAVILAIPSFDLARREAMEAMAMLAGLDFRYMPALPERLRPTFESSLAQLRGAKTSSLLGRAEIDIDRRDVEDYVEGATVLVTGAGGSIGSELCRQLASYRPGRLWLVDHDESALHSVLLDLTRLAPHVAISPVVASIRDAERVCEIFAEARPDAVFHAAALKHVPMLEAFPEEGIKTNVHGTRNVLSAAQHVGVRRFVNISTDKAADPINALGFTKRIAERLTAHHANTMDATYLSVRFGNVLGSRGSVLPTFMSQIEQGGPVTITDPEMTRYFMTISEAVTLVLLGAAIGQNGRVLVLDMGQPVKIVDLATELIRRSGRDIALQITGARPGEKLTESLFSGADEAAERVHPAIMATTVPSLAPAAVSRVSVAELPSLASAGLPTGSSFAETGNGRRGADDATAPRSVAWPDPRRTAPARRRATPYTVVKRALDVVVAGTLLLLSAPVLAIVALAVRIRLGRPVLFRQMRPGLRGAPFELVKFRSLRDLKDENGQLLPFERRLTRFGSLLRSTSLDELPELLNVLRGDMSLVGPRPLLMDYLHRYDERQAMRHLVKPGLTGLAQVRGRESLSWEEKFALDIDYVERASLRLDLSILAATVRVMLARQHVTPEGQATSSYFLGTPVEGNRPVTSPVKIPVAAASAASSNALQPALPA